MSGVFTLLSEATFLLDRLRPCYGVDPERSEAAVQRETALATLDMVAPDAAHLSCSPARALQQLRQRKCGEVYGELSMRVARPVHLCVNPSHLH